jgi:hypothetical protein
MYVDETYVRGHQYRNADRNITITVGTPNQLIYKTA